MRVNPRFSGFRQGVATLAAIALTLSPMSTSARKRTDSAKPKTIPPLMTSQSPSSKMGPMMAMPLVAPVFFEDQEFSSTLVLVNASSENTYATITVRSLTGNIIAEQRVLLTPSNQARVPVADLLRQAGSTETRGSIIVEQSSDLMGMAVLAQLSVTSQSSHVSFIDEELAMPDSVMGSSVLRGVARGTRESILVAISSLSSAEQQISMVCLSQQSETMSRTIELPSGATVLAEACDRPEANAPSHKEIREREDSNGLDVYGLQLVSNAGAGQFAAFGITRHPGTTGPILGAILFGDPKLAVSSSAVFAGLPVGSADLLPGSYKPYVSLANFSARPTHVTISYSRTSGSGAVVASNVVAREINLQPRRATMLYFADLQGDPGLRNSFVLKSDAAPGDVAVSMASRAHGGEGAVELLGKDAEQQENAGAHPWSIAQQNESTLLVFNHTDKEQRAMVTILNGKPLWVKLIKLSPFETLSMSMSQLIKDHTKDDLGRTLRLDLVEGEIIWTMAVPKTLTGRLLVSNNTAAMARSFSCSPFVTISGVSLSPTSAVIPVNGSATFYANPSYVLAYNQGQCSGTSTGSSGFPSYSWSGGGGTINIPTSCSGEGACSPTGTNGGSATLTLQASYYNCTYYPQAQVAVLSATMSQKTSGPPSGDDGASNNYQAATGSTNLGNFVNISAFRGCGIGFETIATINPSTYTGNVIIHRVIDHQGIYLNSTDAGGEKPDGYDDTSLPAYQDRNPQSGKSAGKVYDLDAPGAHPPSIDGNVYRYRTNFHVYAALPDGTVISPSPGYFFYVRLSCQLLGPGFVFINNVPGDNQIGLGTTNTTWNLQ